MICSFNFKPLFDYLRLAAIMKYFLSVSQTNIRGKYHSFFFLLTSFLKLCYFLFIYLFTRQEKITNAFSLSVHRSLMNITLSQLEVVHCNSSYSVVPGFKTIRRRNYSCLIFMNYFIDTIQYKQIDTNIWGSVCIRNMHGNGVFGSLIFKREMDIRFYVIGNQRE